MSLPTASHPHPVPRALSRRQKAAVIAHLLAREGVDLSFGSLPAEVQRRLVRDLASLRFVDRATLAGIVAEFAHELDTIGLPFPKDLGAALHALDGRLSLAVVEDLAGELPDGAPDAGSAWSRLADAGADALVDLMAEESADVCAILLSRLEPDLAADVLGKLPDHRSAEVAEAFPRIQAVGDATIARIGMGLGRQAAERPPPPSDADTARTVAEILNAAPTRLREDVLGRLDDAAAPFAARVRRSIFTWEALPARIDPRDIPKVTRDVDQKTLVTALADASPQGQAVTAFLLGGLSKRLADQIREEIEELGTPDPAAVEDAIRAIVARIRALEGTGELSLIAASNAGADDG